MKEGMWSAKTAVQEAAFRQDFKFLFDGLNKIYGPRENGVMPVFPTNRQTLLSDKFDILHHWKQHLVSVLNTPSDTEEDVIATNFQSLEIQ